ncbi:hypothetical protein EC973_001337 [Apophysomyces ossiformis]|uniref:Hexosyltransferase n=1 Tax=Apophysomyces ossiformis TaxID=679940 RepID=A0A8H7ETD5_9FUNG|nr:hypothetical protein EC973_001337 [Apophysomyces ossiformis]
MGYWSWILTTSMLRRWLYHYELSNAIVRLITLTVINWSVSAFVSSYYGFDQPLWKWMTICLILLVSNVLKIILASSPKYHRKSEGNHVPAPINHKSTVVRILILPLTIVVFITMLAALHQVNSMRSSVQTAIIEMPETKPFPGLRDTKVQVLVIVLSAWTPKSIERRKTFRETTLTLMPRDDPDVSYVYRFILGQPPSDRMATLGPEIEKENETYGDILIVDSSDLYEDLSRKVYATMVWADQYDYDYLIKTDDDIFARWDTITKELQLLGRQTRYWRGLSYWNIPPIRDANNKNSEFNYPLPVFPRYTAGALYILSRDVVHMIGVGKGPRTFVKNEDQNLGIWLYPYKMEPINDPRIQQIDACEEDMIAKHFGDFGEPDALGGTMYDMLENLKQGRKMCTGFRSSICALCYPCHGKKNHWKDWGFNCDRVKGVTLLKQPKWSIME